MGVRESMMGCLVIFRYWRVLFWGEGGSVRFVGGWEDFGRRIR